MQDIPIEILIEILSFLDVRSALAVAEVSSKWYNASRAILPNFILNHLSKPFAEEFRAGCNALVEDQKNNTTLNVLFWFCIISSRMYSRQPAAVLKEALPHHPKYAKSYKLLNNHLDLPGIDSMQLLLISGEIQRVSGTKEILDALEKDIGERSYQVALAMLDDTDSDFYKFYHTTILEILRALDDTSNIERFDRVRRQDSCIAKVILIMLAESDALIGRLLEQRYKGGLAQFVFDWAQESPELAMYVVQHAHTIGILAKDLEYFPDWIIHLGTTFFQSRNPFDYTRYTNIPNPGISILRNKQIFEYLEKVRFEDTVLVRTVENPMDFVLAKVYFEIAFASAGAALCAMQDTKIFEIIHSSIYGVYPIIVKFTAVAQYASQNTRIKNALERSLNSDQLEKIRVVASQPSEYSLDLVSYKLLSGPTKSNSIS